MHVAICDDNIADRKQLERLLQRESDSRINSTGVLYIDSFGNDAALLSAVMTYDVYFIDVVSEEKNGLEVAWELRKSGVVSPIVLCSSTIRYSSFQNQPDHIYHLEKPFKVAELTEKINIALGLKDSKEHTIEIRCDSTTSYVSPENIVYAMPQNHLTLICLKDGTKLPMLGTLNEFFYLVESDKKFIFSRKNLVVNIDYISALSLTRLKLITGEQFRIHFSDWKFTKKFWPAK